eukprot:m.489072 g.489072  ORF g.489072 m.489072 type:complete len:680 (+) comp26352_c0_seq1:136-2175(+)
MADRMAGKLVAIVLVCCVVATKASKPAVNAQQQQQPNILYVMADDLNADWKSDRLAYMSALNTKMVQQGAYYRNHVAAVPVCGPSRSSMLLGRYPHNTGYFMNGDLDSVDNYLAEHNHTVGKWLRDAGYYTGFLGKYVNGCENHVPHGWSHWGGFVQTYNFYNASMFDMEWDPNNPSFEPPVKVNVMTGIHQADFLGNHTLELVDRAGNQSKPFFISVTPVMPHWGTCIGPGNQDYAPTDPHWEWDLVDPTTGRHYSMPTSPCPTVRHAQKFAGHTNPHISGKWNTSVKGIIPKFMSHAFEHPGALTAFQAQREDIGFRNRSAALLDLDHMLDVILTGLEQRGLLDTTYIFFTSDNGYHLGEAKMPFGKGEPYETDIRLPMVVRGPGVPKNVNVTLPTTHLDITATIVELAGAAEHAPSSLDGKSFAKQLTMQPPPEPAAWRTHSYSEFFANDNTWAMVRVTNATHTFSLHRWCSGDNETEVFDLLSDPWQKANRFGTGDAFSAAAVSQYLPLVAALHECKGSNCSAIPQTVVLRDGAAAVAPLACKQIISKPRVGSFSLEVRADGTVGGVHGWQVDFALPGRPRGTDPSTVRLLVDGEPHRAAVPDQVANIPRPDIMKTFPFPNDRHGFAFDLPAGFLPAKGKHGIRVIEVLDGGKNIASLSANSPAKCICDLKPCDC